MLLLCQPNIVIYYLIGKKDRRTEVTFMSPLNGDPATSIDGRAYGRNWFESTKWGKCGKG